MTSPIENVLLVFLCNVKGNNAAAVSVLDIWKKKRKIQQVDEFVYTMDINSILKENPHAP